MTFPFGDTVTLKSRTATGRDVDGNDTYTTAATLIAGCAFDPGGSYEILGQGDTVTTQPTIYFPAGTVPPAAVDEVTVRGVTYTADGTAQVFRSPFTGWTPGPVLRLKEVTG